MNKSEFLSELEKRIRVLDKSEIKDILAEYSQHIDMEISNGQTEDEAIKSFGVYEVSVKLHPKVTGKLKVKVTEAK